MNGDKMDAWVTESHKLVSVIRSSGKPVLAAISGLAIGGGLEMTFHADLRFAASDAKLGQPEVNIAFIPPVGGTQGLVRLVGRNNAFRLLYDGGLLDAAAAQDIGLVDYVVDPDQMEHEVQRYAEALSSKAGNTLTAIRRCLIEGDDMAFADGMKLEKTQAVSLASHPNFYEGISAFLEKREAKWV